MELVSFIHENTIVASTYNMQTTMPAVVQNTKKEVPAKSTFSCIAMWL
jgi:hypothetical protein